MATLNDYKDWLQEVDIDNAEETSQLVHALRHECECGLFKSVPANGANNGWIISSAGVPDTLHLKTPKQLTAFIRHIEATCCEDIDAEIYASFKHAMEKD